MCFEIQKKGGVKRGFSIKRVILIVSVIFYEAFTAICLFSSTF